MSKYLSMHGQMHVDVRHYVVRDGIVSSQPGRKLKTVALFGPEDVACGNHLVHGSNHKPVTKGIWVICKFGKMILRVRDAAVGAASGIQKPNKTILLHDDKIGKPRVEEYEARKRAAREAAMREQSWKVKAA